MNNMVCDFCSSPEIYGQFDCSDFPTGIGTVSTGAWMACHQCYDLVLTGNWEGLLNHSCQTFTASSGIPVDSQMRQFLAGIHNAFRRLKKAAN